MLLVPLVAKQANIQLLLLLLMTAHTKHDCRNAVGVYVRGRDRLSGTHKRNGKVAILKECSVMCFPVLTTACPASALFLIDSK